jgi:hypothetical protein
MAVGRRNIAIEPFDPRHVEMLVATRRRLVRRGSAAGA